MKRVGLHKELFDLCKYIAASAEGLPEEPKDYGPARLLEVLSRLSKIIHRNFGDEFLHTIAREIDKEYVKALMTDKNAFYKLLMKISSSLAKEGNDLKNDT